MDVESNSALSTVLERFRRTQQRVERHEPRQKAIIESTAKSSQKPEDSESVVHAEGLSALPQPELVEQDLEKPALEWPVTPQFIAPNDPQYKASFASLGVSSPTCHRLSELGYEESFAVQTAIIPQLLQLQRQLSPDPLPAILVNSFTGSGKTLAYAVPIVDLLRTRRVPRVRALILLPTIVLIQQVYSVFDKLAQGTNLRILALKSDRTLHKESQLLTLPDQIPDIVIAAPGRLIEHLSLLPSLLQDLQMLVVDEADRLLGQSFQNWTEVLAKVLPTPDRPLRNKSKDSAWKRPPQRLVFSATLTRDPAKLAALQIRALPPMVPKLYVIGNEELDGNDEFNLPSQLHERVVNCRSLGDKPLVLVHELLNSVGTGRVIVFVRSNESAVRLARLISLVSSLVFGQHIEANRCSGEMRAPARHKVMREFAEATSGVLVCTDMIARGIDMHIDYVVNYDVPAGPREYVHRVGRTARAGAEGSAWTLLAPGSDQTLWTESQRGVSRSSSVETEQIEPEVDFTKYEAALSELGQEVMGFKEPR